MISITVAGNVGKDPVLRSTNGDSVLGFSVASTAYANGEKVTQWVDVSVWGKRAQALSTLISKGSKVTVVGSGSLSEHNGKTYLKVRAFEVELQGGGQQQGERQARQPASAPPAQSEPPPLDDDIPW